MADLSDDELAELRETFNHFDLDGNGRMDTKELANLLTSLGGDDAADGLDAAIAALDSDGNGTIEFDEFVEWWTER